MTPMKCVISLQLFLTMLFLTMLLSDKLFSTIRKLLPLLFLFSFSLSLHAGAWTLTLPGEVTYEFEGDISELNRKSFRYVEESKGTQSTELTLHGSQGYIQYLGANEKIPANTEGDLLIAISVANDQPYSSPINLGAKWQLENFDYDYEYGSDYEYRDDKNDGTSSTETVLEASQIVAMEPASAEASAVLLSKQEPHHWRPTRDTQYHGPVTLAAGGSPHYLVWIKVSNVFYGSFDPLKTKILLSGKEYALDDRTPGNLPDRETIVIQHFIPYKHSGFSLTIHGAKPVAQAVRRQGSRELNESDLNDIASLISPETVTSIARRFNITEPIITNIQHTYMASSATERNFQLLKEILEQKGNEFNSETLASKLEEENQPSLAGRIRENRLQVSAEDEDFQQEMINLAEHINPYTAILATAMGYPKQDQDTFLKAANPSYSLLYKSSQQQRLHKLSQACEQVGLEAIPLQIDTSNDYPILASRIRQESSPQQAQWVKKATLLPVEADHIDPDLLRLKMPIRECLNLTGPICRNNQRLQNFAQKVENIPGARKFKRQSGIDVERSDLYSNMSNVLFTVMEDKYPHDLSYGKFVAVMNHIGNAESQSIALRAVKRLEEFHNEGH